MTLIVEKNVTFLVETYVLRYFNFTFVFFICYRQINFFIVKYKITVEMWRAAKICK